MLHIGVLDLFIAVTFIVMNGVLSEFADWRVLVVLIVVRFAVMLADLTRLLAPIRAWQRHESSDERLLLAADQAVGQLHKRFGAPYLLMWLITLVVAMLLGHLGIPRSLPIGAIELLCGALFSVAMIAGSPAMLRPIFDNMLLEVRTEINAELIERGEGSWRATESIGRSMLHINLGLLTAVTVALASGVIHVRADGLRDTALAEQRGRATITAMMLREGTLDARQLEPGVALVSSSELPMQLGGHAGGHPQTPDGVLAAIDREAELAIAAVQLDGERWVLAQAEVDQQLGGILLTLVVFVLLTLVPTTIANLALNRSLTISVRQLDDAARRIADRGDLRELERLVPQRRDELGALASSFNRMIDVLEQLAAAAAAVAEGDLRVELEGPGDLQDAFRGMLARLHAMVVQIRQTALEVATAAGQIQTTTREQEHALEHQSQRMLSVSEAVTTLAQSAEDISHIALEVLDNAEQTLATSDAMVDRIAALRAQTSSVSELLDLIREIADRSDLLALNGSLEATRVGEAGRGFALVAAEMRRLAERVTGTVGDVRERISDIESAGSSTVVATEDSRKLANDTAAAARKISTVTQRQSKETEQVSIKVYEVAEVMIATVEASNRTHTAAEGLSEQAAELERLTGQFRI